MVSWRKAFRVGFCPQLSDRALEALELALVEDSPKLIQGGTTSPPPLQCVQDWPCEAACPVAYAGWQGEGLKSVAEVEEFFANVCFKADQALKEPAACRHFLQWFDDQPRALAVPLLLGEVRLAREGRA
jgi:hypothetical protein